MLTDRREIEGMPASEVEAEIRIFNRLLAIKESGGRYQFRNELGFVGLYQIGAGRLADYNRVSKTDYTLDDLLSFPALQESVQIWHMQIY